MAKEVILLGMTRLPFRDFHIMQILQTFENESCPLDLFLSRYFRAHKSLGSSDRAAIAEAVYKSVRLWGLRCNYLQTKDLERAPEETLPKDLWTCLYDAYGEQAYKISEELNYQAPTTIRANLLKITRDDLLEKLRALFPVRPCPFSPAGIIFEKKTNFFILPEFTAGLFEVQDEASQLVAHHVHAKPGDHVLDYCSGSGGKSLAIATRLQGRGQLYLHDVRKGILQQAKKRLARAGIQNAQLLHHEESRKLSTLKGHMDWVLADVPCTGTGTMRRNPDMKWRFTKSALERLVQEQRAIFEEALTFMKPKGRIVYATCSLLPDENQRQTEHFLKKFPLAIVGEPFTSFPARGHMDGFYAVVFEHIKC